MNVWLDDVRPMPDGYDTHVKTAEEAIALLEAGNVFRISLDHDLGQQLTGYDVAKWIEQHAINGSLKKLECLVHTQNPAGRRNILFALKNANNAWLVVPS